MTDFSRTPVSRRKALAWLAAAGASLSLGPTPSWAGSTRKTGPEGISWPQVELTPLKSRGYGTDPVMNPPLPAPWERTMTAAQLELTSVLADLVCPGSAKAGVPDVIDEWVSAPYPMQQQHRSLLIPGFAWLDRYSQIHFAHNFTNLAPEQWTLVLNLLDSQVEVSEPGMELPAIFFNAFRLLVAGVYFTSPEGIGELGYEGNVPIQGDYPGPSPEALTHLSLLLDELGLA